MPGVQRVGDLEIDQDLDYQRPAWVWQRIGWGLIALSLLAALLGFFGTGPLSKATVRDEAGGLQMEHDHLVRYQSPTRLRVLLSAGAASQSKVRVWLSHRYIKNVQIPHITPEPESVEIGPDRLIYTFSARPADTPMTITFGVEPEKIGALSGNMGVEGGSSVAFSQFVYP